MNYKIYNNYNDYKGYPAEQDPAPQGKGYKSSPVFIQLTIIHDFTAEFIELYINYKSRTRDQMEQVFDSEGQSPQAQTRRAARSSKQCWAEGFLQKSLEGRLKMIGVTRGSSEELLNDYQDYLRQHKLEIWDKSDPRSLAIRKIAYKTYKDYNDYKDYISPPETAANAMIILINQTNQMIDQKYRWEEDKFIREGGFRENLLKKRLEYRGKL